MEIVSMQTSNLWGNEYMSYELLQMTVYGIEASSWFRWKLTSEHSIVLSLASECVVTDVLSAGVSYRNRNEYTGMKLWMMSVEAFQKIVCHHDETIGVL